MPGKKNGRIISLAGFNGGRISGMSDVAFIANMESYERIEDVHLEFLHMIVCWMKANQDVLEKLS